MYLGHGGEFFKPGTAEPSINNDHGGERLGIASLMFWAKNDNPKMYIKSKEASLKTFIDGSVGYGADADYLVGKVIYEYYKDELNCVNDHQNRDFDEYCALFDCMIDPDNRRYLSEDYAFCRRWQQIGGKIFADCGTTLGHVGNLPFTGCLNDRLKA